MSRHLSQWVPNLLIGSLILTTAIGPSPAFAQSRRYVPPRGGSAPASYSMGGSRTGSCTEGNNAPFTALAPISYMGQTAATRPTVALYVPDRQPRSIEFRIYQYDSAGKLQPQPLYKTELPSQPGIMPVTLPASEPELTVGQRYFWQAALICDSNHGSEDLIVGADLEVVPDTSPESERWYDLFQAALDDNPASATDLLQQLASSERTAGENMQKSEAPALAHQTKNPQQFGQEIIDLSNQLNQIVAAEHQL